MDVDYMDAEIIETLNILRPPVKRNLRKHPEYIGYLISSSDSIREKNRTSLHHRPAKPSLSLILQKCCKKQIFQKYSDRKRNPVIFQNQVRKTITTDKPTINVTVVSNTDTNNLFEFLNTSKQAISKHKKDTAPFLNEIITSKNVYLVVAGNRQDKIYEFKTVDSKTFKNSGDDVKKILDNKNIFSKMEKKRKRSTKLDVTNLEEDKFLNLTSKGTFPQEGINRDNSGSSRVRIVGQIGLNKNDNYVMKCAATVNGQPVSTNYVQVQNAMTENSYEPYRDLKVSNRFGLNEDKSTKTIYQNKRSQGTQINGNTAQIKFCATFDRSVQCNMCTNTNRNTIDDGLKKDSLHRSTSPLVIISVYPKSEANTNENSSTDRYGIQNYRSELKNNKIVNNLSLNTELYNTRERSPNKTNVLRCCPCETDKQEDVKTNKKTAKKNANPPASPRNKSPTPNTKSTQQYHKKVKSTDTNVTKPKSRSPSPNRLQKFDKQQKDSISPKLAKKPIVINKNKPEIRKQLIISPRSKPKARDKHVSTATVQTANVLQNKLNKKVTNNKRTNNLKPDNKKEVKRFEETVLKKYFPKNNISKVSINKESDREFYGLMVEKGNVSTDFTVRSTGKDNFGQKYYEEMFENNFENDYKDSRYTDSMENFLPKSEMQPHKVSASQSFDAKETDKDELLEQAHTSRLNVRDSLEIGRRRGHSRDPNHSDGEDLGFRSARTKHYPGDDCSISDPFERDKEIRELLGIDKKRIDKKHNDEIVGQNMRHENDVIANRCAFHNTRCKTIKQLATEWSCSAGIKLIDDKQNYKTRPIIKRDEEKSITDDEKQSLKKLVTVSKIKRRNVLLQARVKIPCVMKQQSTQFNAREHFDELITGGKQINSNDKNLTFKPSQNRKIIQLTRKQYRRIKKSIYKVNVNQRKCWKPVWNSSLVSLGNVKAKRKSEYTMHWNKEVQTDAILIDLKKPYVDEPKCAEYNLKVFPKMETKKRKEVNKVWVNNAVSNYRKHNEVSVKKVASSVEIRYASVLYNQNIIDVERYFTNATVFEPNLIKREDSIETLFRGQKKSHTPNLGTSALSLLSEENKSVSQSNPDLKPRKPFLRRLMSCLVMRSQTTQVKLPARRRRPPTLESSVDSYHISTSLGAIEMSSSMYDTSASFFSNHTIGAINNRTKRGFFTSVRGFLSSKLNDVVVNTSRKH